MSLFNDTLPPGLESALTGIEKQFILMRSAGESIRDIARKLKKSTRTICDWNKKFAKKIIGTRNAEFCDLQKKVIESKTERLNFLKREFNRTTKILEEHKIDVDTAFSGYNNFLDLYIKLSDLMSTCESDILTVGVKFKDNIEPEINHQQNEDGANIDSVIPEVEKNNLKIGEKKNTIINDENTSKEKENLPRHVFKKSKKKIIDNSELKSEKKQSKTNYNMKTP